MLCTVNDVSGVAGQQGSTDTRYWMLVGAACHWLYRFSAKPNWVELAVGSRRMKLCTIYK